MGSPSAPHTDLCAAKSPATPQKIASGNPNPTAASPELWSARMKRKIEKGFLPDLSPRKNKIAQVPKCLLRIRPHAYSPQFLSVGPLNACFSLSSSMDLCKSLCLTEFLRRRQTAVLRYQHIPPRLHQLEDFLDYHLFRRSENPITNYFDIPNCGKKTLKLLIALDSVFVLEFVHFMVAEYLHADMNTRYNSTAYIWKSFNNITLLQMKIDLFIIGNQVRLSNLVRLMQYERRHNSDLGVILDCAISKWSPFNFQNIDNPISGFQSLLLKCEHLLDCLYQSCVMNSEKVEISILPSHHVKEEHLKLIGRIPRASELHKIGVKFKGVNGNTSIIGYDSKNLILQLPKLVVYNETEIMLRNLVAYEITSKQERHMCEYVTLMNSLIGKIDDLDILYKAGVLENCLGSDEKMLLMWNDVYKYPSAQHQEIGRNDSSYYQSLQNQLA